MYGEWFLSKLFFYSRFKYSAKSDFNLGDIINHDLNKKNIFLIVLGSISLFLGGKFVVDSVIAISQSLNLSQFLMSATVIAIGTSLPELITSIQALRKRKKRIAIGNIIGSNIFNILWVLGFVSLFRPIIISPVFLVDMVLLFIFSIIFFIMVLTGKQYRITKTNGLFFLSLYLLYIVFIVIRG